jgi:hypothetical protein
MKEYEVNGPFERKHLILPRGVPLGFVCVGLLAYFEAQSMLLRYHVAKQKDPRALPVPEEIVVNASIGGSGGDSSTSAINTQRITTQGLSDSLVNAILLDFDTMSSCGYFKCFFKSMSDTKTGWLVTRAHRFYKAVKKSKTVLPFIQKAHEFAIMAEHKYGMRHLHAQAPFYTGPLSAANGNLFATKFNSSLCNQQKDCRLVPRSPSGFVIQKVFKAPPDALLAKLVVPDLDVNATQAVDATTVSMTLSPALEDTDFSLSQTFCDNFQEDLRITQSILENYPLFAVDFQFLVTRDGHLYHLDLDRLFDADLNPPQWKNKFYQHVKPSLQILERQICEPQTMG